MDFVIPKRRYRMMHKPAGPYAVGCTDIMTAPGTSGIFFRFFYPTVPVQDAEPTNWLPDKKYLKGFAKRFNIWPPLFTYFHPVFAGEIYIPAFWNAPPLANETQFPVIVFSHGLFACRTIYSTMCLELASNGYVVAVIEHRDQSASATFFLEVSSESSTQGSTALEAEVTKAEDRSTSKQKQEPKKTYIFLKTVKADEHEYQIRNEQLHMRSKECSLLLDWLHCLNDGGHVTNILDESFPLHLFKGLLDLDRTCLGGQSFGGTTVITTLARDKRFKIGFGLDPWMLPLRGEEVSTFSAANQRMLFINTETFQTEEDMQMIRKIESASPLRLDVVRVKGIVHMSQTDTPFVISRLLKWLFQARSRLDPFQAMDLTTRLTMAFLSKHLDLPRNEEHENYLRAHQEVICEEILSQQK